MKQACLAAATYQIMVKSVPVSCVSQAVPAAYAAGCFDAGTTPHVCATHPTSSCVLVSCHEFAICGSCRRDQRPDRRVCAVWL